MSTVVLVFSIWMVLSLLVGTFMGRFIAFGESGEVAQPAPAMAAPDRRLAHIG